ncbi:MAG: ankyrin repeat domain-containing protein [Planctomycetota bacterium]
MDRLIWLDRLIIGIAKNVSALLLLLIVLLYYSFWILLPIFLCIYLGIAIRDNYIVLGSYIPFVFAFIIVLVPYVYTLIRIPNMVSTIARFPALLLGLGNINIKEYDRALFFRSFDPLSVAYDLSLMDSKVEIIVKYPEDDKEIQQYAVHRQIRTALSKQRFEVFNLLLKQIENINDKKDDIKDGYRPLIFDAIEAGQYEYVAATLDRGANINEPDNYRGKITALHLACQKGYCEIVRLLIACGANVNAKDQWGRTPLLEASQCHGGFPEVIDLLISNGAEKDGLNRSI